MSKSTITKTLIDIYAFIVLFGIIMWIPFPDLGHIIGASSLIQAFLLAGGDVPRWVGYLCLIWIGIFLAALVISYIVACRKNKYKPMLYVMGMELLVAGGIIVYIIGRRESYLLFITLTGYMIRLAYFILVVYNYKIETKID